MKVFRMQDKYNVGPFVSDLSKNASIIALAAHTNWIQTYISIERLHPGPLSDGLSSHLIADKNLLFGCPSLYMICRWFHPLFSVMEELGLKVVEYNAPNAHISRSMSQVVFCRTTAMRLRSVGMEELLKHKESYESSTK